MADLIFWDVDYTLEISGGPVRLQQIVEEFQAGNTCGICGNWEVLVKAWPSWERYIAIIGPFKVHGYISPYKVVMLNEIKKAMPNYDNYIMIGNILQPSGRYADLPVADATGFQFTKEIHYAEGRRIVPRSEYPKITGIRKL